ncbi:DUF6470 family protein [Alkalicoccobacillus porphyridii]|uniref:Uncharacterized protein n=1 Tax=Alkalicoccobacillus porphyridii TaxID=2597270 RepID=A0A554A3S2_9BACI|nr:DUF6470 family protein [Alkalicoccobacillus porphyridii]TSB48339.1 hypothetical protein FN960_01945 [Alkalicoccobacillus porphyridii]
MLTSRLFVQTTPAVLKTETSRPPMSINQEFVNMTITKTGSDFLSISSEAAKLFIDQSRAFEEANLKKITQLTKEWAQQGKAAAMNYAADKAHEGNQLARIERGITVASLTKQKLAPEVPASTIQYMPHSVDRVRIHVERGDLQVIAPDSKLHIEMNANSLDLRIPKWEVKTQVVQKPAISFTFEKHV